MHSVSTLRISLSQFQRLQRSPCVYLSWSHTNSSVCCLCFISQTPTGLTQTLSCSSSVHSSPRRRVPWAWAYTLAISFHLCIRQGVSLAPFRKGRFLWLVLGELISEGAAEDQVVKRICWLFSLRLLDDQNTPLYFHLNEQFSCCYILSSAERVNDLVEREIICRLKTAAYETVPARTKHLSDTLADFFIKAHLVGKCLSEWLRGWDKNATRKIPLPGGLSAARLLSKLLQIHLRKHRAALESFTGINTH